MKKSCVARVRNIISVGACKFAKQNLECGGKGVEKWWEMVFLFSKQPKHVFLEDGKLTGDN